MSNFDGKSVRPARRHAHTCRVCDAAFGCKAELLEHEQERHIQGQNKASRRKSNKASMIERSSHTEMASHELEDRKQPRESILVGYITVDHEEIYDSRGGTSGSKLSKKDINVTRKQPHAQQLPALTTSCVAVTALNTNVATRVQEGTMQNEWSESLPSSMSVPGRFSVLTKMQGMPGNGSATTTVSNESDVSNHVSDITCPDCSGVAEVVTKQEVIQANNLIKSSERNLHTNLPSVDVMTVLGLKRRKKDNETKHENDNSAIEKNQSVSGMDHGESASKSAPTCKTERTGGDSNESHVDLQLKKIQSSINASRLEPTMPVEVEADSIREFGSTSTSYMVIETLPASDMFIDSAECSHEVTVIETPSSKGIRRKTPTTPPKSVVASLLQPANNPSALNAKRHATATPSNPRMVSVLLLNRDNKTVSSPGCDSKAIVADGDSSLSKASIEENIREAVRRLDTAASLVEINSSTREFRPNTVSMALPTGKSCIALTILPKAKSVTDPSAKSPVVLQTSNFPVEKSMEVVKVIDELPSSDATEQQSLLETEVATIPINPMQTLDDNGESQDQNSTSKESEVKPGGVNFGSAMSTEEEEENVAHMCKFCSRGYESFEELENHLMSDHVCKQCGREFRQVANLRKHIRVSHENVRPHQCPVCGKGFAFASNLSAHFPIHFQFEDGEEKQFTCMYCERAFKHSASMRKHMKEEHVEGSKPHVCLQCNKSFVFKCALDCHMRKHSGFRPFTCTTCGTGFKHLSNLQKHVKVLHPGPCPECLDESQQCEHVLAARAALKAKFTCTECNRSYDSAASLTVHVRSHTGEKPETCTVCNRSFQHRSNLQKHMMKHAGRKPHACTLCPRAFYARHNLIAHMRKHTGNSPHECKTCGKRFCTKNSLQVHMNLHANVRPFACDVCGRQFSQLGNLQKHMSVHTGERPHVCGVCKRSFTDMSALKRHHAAIHERDARYACEVCDKRFLHLSSVRSHRLLHTGVKPHKCETCGKAFTHKSGWLRHVRLHERSNNGVISAIVGKDKEVVLKPGEYIVYLTE